VRETKRQSTASTAGKLAAAAMMVVAGMACSPSPNASKGATAPGSNPRDAAPLVENANQRRSALSGARADGPPAPSFPSAEEESLEDRAQIAERSLHRLEWKQDDYRPTESVFDLCNDDQATMAGLDSSMLPDQRYRLNIDCMSSRNRFGYVPPGDTLRQANSRDEAIQALEQFAAKSRQPGMLMGHTGPSWRELGLSLQPAGEGFAVVRGSIRTAGGATRGLFVSVSEQVAHNVVLTSEDSVVRYPLSVQPGETTAFEFPVELGDDQLARLTIAAQFVGEPDQRRSLLITGTPGSWSGSKKNLAKLHPPVDLSGAGNNLHYFETQLWFRAAPSLPEAEAGRAIRAPVVIAAALDSQHKVIALFRPPVVTRDDKNSSVSSVALQEAPSVGFLTPAASSALIICAGGADTEAK
jgi:hypothetical protein